MSSSARRQALAGALQPFWTISSSENNAVSAKHTRATNNGRVPPLTRDIPVQQHLRPLQRLRQRDAKTQFGLQFENAFFQPSPNMTGLSAGCSSVFGASWLVCVAINPRKGGHAGNTAMNAKTRSALLAQYLWAAPVTLGIYYDTTEWASLDISIGIICVKVLKFRHFIPAIPYTSRQVFPLVHHPTPRIYRCASDMFSDFFAPHAPLSANAVENIFIAQSGLEHVSRLKKKQNILTRQSPGTACSVF